MANNIPLRKDVPESDKWDLSSIYKSDDDWEADLKKISSATKNVLAFKIQIGKTF